MRSSELMVAIFSNPLHYMPQPNAQLRSQQPNPRRKSRLSLRLRAMDSNVSLGRHGLRHLPAEFNCVSKLGQAKANATFAGHWDTWINQSDIQTIQSYGLNTIRMPVGYWMMESLVYSNERFPQGGLEYLQRVCGWASDAGLFIIIDMHGAPGAQSADQELTGQVSLLKILGFS